MINFIAAVAVNFANGETEKVVNIPIVNDGVFETNETINLALINPTNGAAIGTQNTATLTIVDNDSEPGSIAFSGSIYSVSEDGTPISAVTLVRTGGSNGEVSVTLTPSNGTAISPDDYNNAPITVTFASGETSKTVTIPIDNDTSYEDTETVNLTLSAPTNGATLGSRTTAVLNIVDNDAVPGTIEFDNTNYTVNEDGTVVAAVTLIRTGGSDGVVSVRVTPTNGTATAGDDYVNRPVTVTFANGETTKTVTIPIINDAGVEANETINLTLSNPNGGATLGSQKTAILTINDNDFKARLTVDIAVNSVNESDGTVAATISRNTPTDTALNVSLRSTDTSEIITPETVTIPVGESSVTVDLNIAEDNLIEKNRRFTVVAAAQGFITGTDDVEVIDTDAVNLSLSLDKNTVIENAGNTAVIGTVSRDFVTEHPLVVYLTSNNSDAIRLPQTVTIEANQASAEFQIDILDNEQVNGNQSVTITASPSDSIDQTPLENGQANITLNINDNEAPSLKLVINRDVIPENPLDGVGIGTVSRNTGFDQDLVVNLTSSDLTEAQVPFSITIPANQTSVNFSITGVPDDIADGRQPVTITATTTDFNSSSLTLEVSDINVPDLVITDFSSELSLLTGEQASFTYRVENKGLTTASGSWIDRYFLSDDNKRDINDVFLGESSFTTDFGVGDYYEKNIPFFVPRTYGQYYLIAEVDTINSIDEGVGISETNNTTVLPINVLPAYDGTVSTNTEIGIAGQGIILQGQALSNEDNSPVPYEFVTIAIENSQGIVREINAFTDGDGNFVREFLPLPTEGGEYKINAYFPDYPDEDITPEDTFTILGMGFVEPRKSHQIIADDLFSTEVELKNFSDIPLTDIVYTIEGAPDSWTIEVNAPSSLAGDANVPRGKF